MKLEILFSEAKVHPDLIPVLNKLTAKLIKQMKAAGVEMMPAKTDLKYEQGWSSKEQPTPHDRWQWSRSGPIWLAGYINMGPVWVSVYITIQGHVWTERQRSYDHIKDDTVYEVRDRWFKDFDGFIKYVTKTVKPFVAKEPIDRLLDYIKAKPLTIQYDEPTIETKSGEGLDDEDKFAHRGGQQNVYYGVMDAVAAMTKLIARGKTIDYQDLSIVVDGNELSKWLEWSGFHIEDIRGRYKIVISPIEIYSVDYTFSLDRILNFPNEVAKPLQQFVTEIASKIVRIANKRQKNAQRQPPQV